MDEQAELEPDDSEIELDMESDESDDDGDMNSDKVCSLLSFYLLCCL